MSAVCYILSSAQVTCQQPLSEEWLDNPLPLAQGYVRSVEPDVRQYISAAEARRMGRLLKRSTCTALSALRLAGVNTPDAIVTGTGAGCFDNTEKFLRDLTRYGEECLTPTLFMQSTHNTVSSQIAIMLGCHGYNSTYSHGSLSFGSALLDAWLQIKSGQAGTALVGAHDEVTPLMAGIIRVTRPQYNAITETSVSTVLSSAPGTCAIRIEDVCLMNNPDIEMLLDAVGPHEEGVLTMTGMNGNVLNDKPYRALLEKLPAEGPLLGYKHIFGDNHSASAAGYHAAVQMLSLGRIPLHMCISSGNIPQTVKGIDLINHEEGTAWSVIRLRKP